MGMASITVNGAGVVVLLEHDEIEGARTGAIALGSSTGPIAAAAVGAGVLTAGVATLLAAVVGAYFGAQAFLITQVDRGCGVYLTIPWPALWFGQVYLIIPTTRPCLTPGAWSTLDSGELRTEDPVDLLNFSVSRAAVDINRVQFELYQAQTSGWAKELWVPGGTPPYVRVEGTDASASVTLAASQISSLSAITFKKAKAFGIMTEVLNLGELGGLRPGDAVRFSWLRDT
jgi:hypothetical protein